jgi:hypothetical protein
MSSAQSRRGFVFVDGLGGGAVVLILLALLLPAVQQTREAARKSQCQDHLHNLAIALHSYEATFKRLPPGSCDGWGKDPETRHSWTVRLLPFIEQKPLYDAIASQGASLNVEGLPDPGERHDFWNVDIDVYRCPSDPGPQRRDQSPSLLSYKASIGDVLNDNANDTRGLFGFQYGAKFAEVTDGLSNTIFMSEMAIGSADPRQIRGGVALKVTDSNPQACWDRLDPKTNQLVGDVRDPLAYPGGRAWDGRAYYAFVATAVTPNGPTCQSTDADTGWGHLTASSFHPGGCQIALGDAKVVFVSQNIDAGNRNAESPDGKAQDLRSPYGVWGGLGTRAGGERLRVP